MDSLFLTRMENYKNHPGRKIIDQSAIIMNKTFNRDTNYKVGSLYAADGELLEECLEFKYQYVYSYSFNKDKVEFLVQFRPYYHPEQKFIAEDGVERLGFLLDVPNDVCIMEKWLIFGRNDTVAFTRYNILKINWTFHWIADGKIYSNIGILRNRNNYNSGVWSDGFVTTVQNEAQFIVPANDYTRTIDYDMRFMLSDNSLHPKVYTVSKVEDTFPPGVIKITLTQGHYDPAKDNVELQLCDYYTNAVTPRNVEDKGFHAEISFSGSEPVLHKSGSYRKISVRVFDDEGQEVTDFTPSWHLRLNGEDVAFDKLETFVITMATDYKSFKIRALKTANVGDILTVTCQYDEDGYYDSIELEVQA